MIGLERVYFSDYVNCLRKMVIFNNLKSMFCCKNGSFSSKKVSEKGVILKTDDGYNLESKVCFPSDG